LSIVSGRFQNPNPSKFFNFQFYFFILIQLVKIVLTSLIKYVKHNLPIIVGIIFRLPVILSFNFVYLRVKRINYLPINLGGHLAQQREKRETNDESEQTSLKDPLHVPVGPITRARSKMIKEALNRLIQEIWADSKSRHSKFGPKEDEGVINLIQVIDGANIA
jgi:hypothetical protein